MLHSFTHFVGHPSTHSLAQHPHHNLCQLLRKTRFAFGIAARSSRNFYFAWNRSSGEGREGEGLVRGGDFRHYGLGGALGIIGI